MDRQIITPRWSLKVMLSIFALAVVQAFVHWKTKKLRIGKGERYPHYQFCRRLMWLMLNFDEHAYARRAAALDKGRQPDPADEVGPEPPRRKTRKPRKRARPTPPPEEKKRAQPSTPARKPRRERARPTSTPEFEGEPPHDIVEGLPEDKCVCRVCSYRDTDDSQQSPVKRTRRGLKAVWFCPGCDDAAMHPDCYWRVPAHQELTVPGAFAYSNHSSQAHHMTPSPNRNRGERSDKQFV